MLYNRAYQLGRRELTFGGDHVQQTDPGSLFTSLNIAE